ncbi:hypothetical protein AB0G04_00650 [Actinoplanes sp. NPDC023801]|uniref:hypothetical protein n=1 Tax=Actinoplanes sp. NPDC023801 TaxID=3154595 RepID=UPI0033CE9E51
MPERDNQAGHSARMLRGLVWAGVVLAPIAAAVVLIGDNSNTARFAVLLIAVSVVLIGASVLVRSDPVLLRMDVEDRVAQEVDAMRRELRAEFSSAAVPAPEVESRPPLVPRNPGGGRAQVYGGGSEPEPYVAQPEFPDRTTFVHQPEPVAYAGQPENGYDDYDQQGYEQAGYEQGYEQSGYEQSGYDESGYDEAGYGYDDGYQDEQSYEPEVPVRAAGGRASVPGIVRPVSPAQISQSFPAQTSQGFPAPAGRASAAVPPAPVARASAAASVPMAPPAVPVGQAVPRPRAAAAVPPPPGPNAMTAAPGPNGMMARPGPNGMMTPPARAAVSVRPAAASVRPGVQYGRPEAPDDDFGAANGYAGTNGHDDAAETSAEYKARRHRPSANDTNVGTLADFANYPGYDSSAQNW